MADATSYPTQKLYNRTLTVRDLSTKTDKNGNPYAAFRGETVDRKSNKRIAIFCMALGKSYLAVRSALAEGATIRVYGAHEQNHDTNVRCFRVVGLNTRADNDTAPRTGRASRFSA